MPLVYCVQNCGLGFLFPYLSLYMPIQDCFSSFKLISTLGHVTAATKPYLFPYDQLTSSSLKIKSIRNNTVVKINFGRQSWQWHQGQTSKSKQGEVKAYLSLQKPKWACLWKYEIWVPSEPNLHTEIQSQRGLLIPWFTLPTCVLEYVPVCGYNQLTLSVVKKYFIFIVVLFSSQKKWKKEH